MDSNAGRRTNDLAGRRGRSVRDLNPSEMCPGFPEPGRTWNGGRIAEVSTGEKFSNIEVQHEDLPPPGPYMNQNDVEGVKERLRDILRDLESKGAG